MKKETQKKLKVFSTPTCPYCHMVKDYLDSHDVEYEDVDVSINRDAAMQMVQKSGEMGVPQLWIEDKVVVGFNKPEIDRLLSL